MTCLASLCQDSCEMLIPTKLSRVACKLARPLCALYCDVSVYTNLACRVNLSDVTRELHPLRFLSRSVLFVLCGYLTVFASTMRHRIAGLASIARLSSLSPQCSIASSAVRRPLFTQHGVSRTPVQLRAFSIASRLRAEAPKFEEYDNSNARPASELNNKITQEEKDDFARKLQEDKGKQIRTPWHREGSDKPPVARQRSAGAMTKGVYDWRLLQCSLSDLVA